MYVTNNCVWYLTYGISATDSNSAAMQRIVTAGKSVYHCNCYSSYTYACDPFPLICGVTEPDFFYEIAGDNAALVLFV